MKHFPNVLLKILNKLFAKWPKKKATVCFARARLPKTYGCIIMHQQNVLKLVQLVRSILGNIGFVHFDRFMDLAFGSVHKIAKKKKKKKTKKHHQYFPNTDLMLVY